MNTASKKRLFLQSFADARGIVATACKAVGISRVTFYNWRAKDSKFNDAVADIEETQIDIVESKLLSRIDKDDTTAIIFYLKTKGKDRGYVEKIETASSVELKKYDKAIQQQKRLELMTDAELDAEISRLDRILKR